MKSYSILVIIYLFFFINTSFSQVVYVQSKPIYQIFNKLDTIYGKDQILVSGDAYEYPYRNDLGHPFFLSNDFEEGYIVIHEKLYTHIKLKYNIFNQSLVLIEKNNNLSPIAFLPPTDFITEFSIDKHLFRKYHFPESKERFYQVIYDGKIKCIYSWQKNKEESYHNINFSAFKFHEARKKIYLVIDSKLMPFNTNKKFLKLFTPEHKEIIAKYIKENKVKIKKSSNIDIISLITFCDKIMMENNTNNEL